MTAAVNMNTEEKLVLTGEEGIWKRKKLKYRTRL